MGGAVAGYALGSAVDETGALDSYAPVGAALFGVGRGLLGAFIGALVKSERWVPLPLETAPAQTEADYHLASPPITPSASHAIADVRDLRSFPRPDLGDGGGRRRMATVLPDADTGTV